VIYADLDGRRRWAGFVVRNAGVQRIELGDAVDVERVVTTHVQLAARSVRSGAAELTAKAARAVRDVVFEPLAPTLVGARRLVVCPDHVVGLLPFATLPGERDGTYLLEHYELAYVANGTDLLNDANAPASRRVLACGAIDYGAGDGVATVGPGMARPFTALPSSAAEIDAVERACGDTPCVVLRGGAATEAAVRVHVAGATHVHLATHGFCGGDGDPGSLVAGVALAMANCGGGGDDGILTADEAMWLDLGTCGLVVLSACVSGLGAPFAGESLLGLRRSLRIAGARASLTSVWRVGDAATAALMADFYRELFGSGLSPARALHLAQLAALARARAASGEGLPGLWGAFVVEGPG
jgi:CHAT domain-containing protein